MKKKAKVKELVGGVVWNPEMPTCRRCGGLNPDGGDICGSCEENTNSPPEIPPTSDRPVTDIKELVCEVLLVWNPTAPVCRHCGTPNVDGGDECGGCDENMESPIEGPLTDYGLLTDMAARAINRQQPEED